jgi:hypothetical protein
VITSPSEEKAGGDGADENRRKKSKSALLLIKGHFSFRHKQFVKQRYLEEVTDYNNEAD